MGTWDESEHPRDDEGKFTYKNGGSDSVKSDEEKMQRRADLLYPSMKDKEPKTDYSTVGLENYKKEKDFVTGGAANIQMDNEEYIKNLKNLAQTDSDLRFLNSLDYILKEEGGYNNYKGDKPTNLGVTQDIYNIYRKEKGLPSQDVKKINIKEATQIYHKYFWKPSKADKLQHPLDLVYFDMYINSNPREAKNVLNRSDNDVYKFIENRRKFYDDVIKSKPIKEKFRKGWYNRLDNLKKYIDEYYASIK